MAGTQVQFSMQLQRGSGALMSYLEVLQLSQSELGLFRIVIQSQIEQSLKRYLRWETNRLTD